MDEQFLERMESQLTGWADPVERLRAALENDEFQLYCQPIVDLAKLDSTAFCEVLVRLREEERALVPPGEFLPVFEHFRMMPQLDRWVVRHAAQHLARAVKRRLTINISTQTLDDAEFPRFVASQLAAHKLKADSLCFEIDEADALERPAAARQFAEACRAMGVRLFLDGFGQRSVSFAPIKELGVQFVKVDGAITRKLLSSEVAQSKLDAILRASQSLGYAVVAECVESDDVLARLRQVGVPYAQGFGIYAPRPMEAPSAPG